MQDSTCCETRKHGKIHVDLNIMSDRVKFEKIIGVFNFPSAEVEIGIYFL
jgi:hypothetical protein